MATERAVRTPLLLASVALFLMTAGFTAIRTGRDALYLSGDGLFGLPKTYMATAVLSVPQAMAMLWLLPRLGPRRTRILVMAVVMAMTGAYFAVAEPGGSLPMTIFFFAVPLLFSVAFSMLWLLGTEVTEELSVAESTRAFSRFGAASIVGGLAGGVLARGAGPALGPRLLLLIGLLFCLATTVLVAIAHRAHRRRQASIAPDSDARKPSMTDSLRLPGVPLLVAISMAAAITGIFVDFQFYLGAVGGSSEQNTVYFANVYLVLSGASLVLQLVVAPWLQRIAGLRRSLMVLPVALFGGGAAVLILGTLVARAGLRVVEGGIKAGVHRTTWEQAFLRYPKRDRATAKVLVDGLGARIAEGIAGLSLQFWLAFAAGGSGFSALSAPWVAQVSAIWVTVGLTVAASTWLLLTLWLSRKLKREDLHDDDPALSVRAPLPDS